MTEQNAAPLPEDELDAAAPAAVEPLPPDELPGATAPAVDDGVDSAESPPPTPTSAPARPWRAERLALPLLLLILAVGAVFRFTGINWDDYTHLHPDERFLTDVATRLSTTRYDLDGGAQSVLTNPLLYLRTSQSPLNPYNRDISFYVYGNFFMTVTRIVAEATDAVCRAAGDVCPLRYTGYDGVHFVGRALSAIVDLISVALTFLIGRRLYDWRVGLLAALLSAAAVMQIQQSHFFTADNWAAMFSVAAIYGAVRSAENAQRRRWWLFFGVALGLAVANRINVAPLAGMAVVAAVIWLSRTVGSWHGLRTPAALDALGTAVAGVALAALVSIVTFRLAMPYAFADLAIARETALAAGRNPDTWLVRLQSIIGLNPQWLGNLAEIQRLQQPDASFPPALQWTDRAPLLFPLANIVLYGMGVAAGVAALVGLGWAAWQISRGRATWQAHLIPVVWSAGYFVFIGMRWVKSIRYFLPIYPILLLLAAWALVALVDAAGPRRVRRALAWGVTGAVALFTLLWANSFVTIYRQPLTRVAATTWMRDNVPSGATLVYEVNGATREVQLPLRYHVLPARFESDIPLPTGGTLTALRLNYVRSETGTAAAVPLSVTVSDDSGNVFGAADVNIDVDGTHRAVTVPLPGIAVPGSDSGLFAPRPRLALVGADGSVPVVLGTSIIANEHWDDPLPVRHADFDPYGQYYVGIRDEQSSVDGQLPVTWPDSAEKRAGFLRWLESADYIVLSSQRGVWSTPRLPLTYPLTNAYYAALFSGDLGFDLVAQFHADWRIGPLTVSDTGGAVGWGTFPAVGWPDPPWWAAEEAFSVYDHPPVWIFAKSDGYSAERARTLLEAVDLSGQMTMNPGQATAAPTALRLAPATAARQQANGTFTDIFNPDSVLNRFPALAAVAWWLAVVALGWLTWPLAFVVLGGLPSRGYALARVLGLLLVSYFGWLTASLGWLPNTRTTYAWGVLALALVSAAAAWPRRAALRAFIRRHRRYLLLTELVALALFGLGLLLRLGNPDVWDVIWGGEKPMDLSYFTATLKSITFPPYDPWYAGGYINYYYYGFVFIGALTQLLGIVPTVAYNLAVALLFSLTGLGAFALAADLVVWRGSREARAAVNGANGAGRLPPPRFNRRALGAGLTAAVLCVLLGNLGQLRVILTAAQRMGDPTAGRAAQLAGGFGRLLAGDPAPLYTGDWFWLASRAINVPPGEAAPITEFPFFTFLYGDLHAHMIALPLTLLALGWALSVALAPVHQPRGRLATPAIWLVGGLTIGVLYPTNSWDWPTYLVIGVLALALHAWRREGAVSVRMVGQTVLGAALLVALTVVLFLPFRQTFGAGYQSFELWSGPRTALGDYIIIYGLFLLLTLTHLAREVRAWLAAQTVETLERVEPIAWLLGGSVIGFGLVTVFVALQWVPVALLALPIVVGAGLLSLRPTLPANRRAVLALIASAYALTLLVELVIVPGTIGRMNTVFKFYMQVWVLLSVTMGAALAWAWPSVARGWDPTRRVAWRTALALLLLTAALYPPLAFNAKRQSRVEPTAPRTLDGMAFMPYADYIDEGQTIDLAPDYAAIRWLQRNVSGSPVVAEATSGNYYRSIANRVAMYTGLPAIIGWSGHQSQQRIVVPDAGIDRRMRDVAELFNTVDTTVAQTLLARYDVGYVYVGPLEQAYYSAEGLAKFDQMAAAGWLETVYQQDGVTIYAVRTLPAATESRQEASG